MTSHLVQPSEANPELLRGDEASVIVCPAQKLLSDTHGGEASWALNILESLTLSHHVRCLAMAQRTEISKTIASDLRIVDFQIRDTGIFSDIQFMLRYSLKAFRLLHSDRFHILHHMFPFGFRRGFNPLAMLTKLERKPFVIGPIQYPQKYTDITDYQFIAKRSGGAVNLSYRLQKPILRVASGFTSLLQELTLREADALVFDSCKTFNLYKSVYPKTLEGKITEVIPPGVELEKFQYSLPREKGFIEILTVGYLLKRKGIQHLLEAFRKVLDRKDRVRLKIVGDGPYKLELMKYCKKISIEDSVVFTGQVPRSRVPECYSGCDVYVQPSLSETFPSAVREAMASGRPVIATKVGFVDEHIADGVNGYVVPSNDPDSLAAKILLLLESRELRLRMGEAAREYAERNFSWATIGEKWHEIYQKLLAVSRAPRLSKFKV